MTHFRRLVVGVVFSQVVCTMASAQTPVSQTDVYHVHFTKAVPGQATALGDFLKAATPPRPCRVTSSSCGINRVTIGITASSSTSARRRPSKRRRPQANPGRDLRAWHNDTFVSGPSWSEFTKALGIGDASASTGGSVYSVAVWRAAPGHREALEKTLRAANPNAKAPVSSLVFTHLEGGPWQYLAVSSTTRGRTSRPTRQPPRMTRDGQKSVSTAATITTRSPTGWHRGDMTKRPATKGRDPERDEESGARCASATGSGPSSSINSSRLGRSSRNPCSVASACIATACSSG